MREVRAACALVLFSVCAPAQSVLRTIPGPQNDDSGFGRFANAAGDVDADGVPDLIVGAPNDDDPSVGGYNNGSASVHSGADGALLLKFYGPVDSTYAGTAVAGVGDVDQDGYDDIAYGATEYPPGIRRGRVWLRSGFDGSVLWIADGVAPNDSLGSAIAALGDVDGDGVPDVALGAYQWDSGNGYVQLRSGASGTILRTLIGAEFGSRFGEAVAGVGDIDGDGASELLVGAYKHGFYVGAAFVHSGATGALLLTVFGTGETGQGVAAAGDVDGDSVPDFVVGSPGEGAARIHSGVDGSTLSEAFEDGFFLRFGQTVAGMGDVTGDGVPDFAAGAIWADHAGNDTGSVYAFSGADGSLLFRIDGHALQRDFGHSLANLGDTDGDGLDDLVAGKQGFPWHVRVLSAACVPGESGVYCEAAPNSQGPGASIGFRGSRSISANDFELTVTGCPPLQVGMFLFAHGRTQTPFGEGWRCIAGDYTRRLRPLNVVDATGTASRAIDFDQQPTQFIPGGAANFQFWYRDPMGPGGSGFNASDALSMMFCR